MAANKVVRKSSTRKTPASLETFVLACLPRPVDFQFLNHGSICLLRPLTDAAREWVDEHIGADNGYQPQYPTVLIEPRYCEEILSGISDAGFSVGGVE